MNANLNNIELSEKDNVGTCDSHVQWGRQGEILLGAFNSYRSLKKLTDTTLVCEGKFYYAHKLLLSASCTYFDKIFSELNCSEPVVILNNIGSPELEALLDLIYIGQVSLPEESLRKLLEVADCLQFKGIYRPGCFNTPYNDGKTQCNGYEPSSDSDSEVETYELNLDDNSDFMNDPVMISEVGSDTTEHYIHDLRCEEVVNEELIDDCTANIKVDRDALNDDLLITQETLNVFNDLDFKNLPSSDNLDHDFTCENRKKINDRCTMRRVRKNRSVVYKFFTKDENGLTMSCILCSTSLNASCNRTVLLQHLKTFHSDNLKKENKRHKLKRLEEIKKLTVFKFFMPTNHENKFVCKICEEVVVWKRSPLGFVRHLKRKHAECWNKKSGKLNINNNNLVIDPSKRHFIKDNKMSVGGCSSKKFTSLVWNVYVDCGQSDYRQCLLCGQKVHFKNNSSTLLLLHLEVNHLELLLNDDVIQYVEKNKEIKCFLPVDDVITRRSTAWEFFEEKENKLQCKLCNRILHKSKSTTVLLRHLRSKHKDVRQNFLQSE